MTGWLSVSLAGLGGTLFGGLLMYFGARHRFRTKLDAMRRARGMDAFQNGLAMGLTIRPTFVRDGKLEHWDADAASCLRSLILPSTFAPTTEDQ
jgi:hypothetical protein